MLGDNAFWPEPHRLPEPDSRLVVDVGIDGESLPSAIVASPPDHLRDNDPTDSLTPRLGQQDEVHPAAVPSISDVQLDPTHVFGVPYDQKAFHVGMSRPEVLRPDLVIRQACRSAPTVERRMIERPP